MPATNAPAPVAAGAARLEHLVGDPVEDALEPELVDQPQRQRVGLHEQGLLQLLRL